jgi:hypothetical protein
MDEPMVKLQGSRDKSAICIDGQQISVIDGVVTVPARMAAVLEAHGFGPYVEPPKRARRILPEGEAPAADEAKG